MKWRTELSGKPMGNSTTVQAFTQEMAEYAKRPEALEALAAYAEILKVRLRKIFARS
ncbi:hypothetical protein LEP3755_48270 [Leptolyngbya sp. NIES-3755]|nr:hypothetical protein LEP3755_48270 [Leptolyngbya sp. NIES-3755]